MTFMKNALGFHVLVQICLQLLSSLVRANPLPISVPAVLSPYALVPATCPASPLVRPADDISTSERQYYEKRYPNAVTGLKQWLHKVGVSFNVTSYPTIALTTSGGGYRSLLTGAGVIQALDARDSDSAVGGLYQGLSYQAGLSGGSWLLSSLAGNGYPTITSLKTGLWESAFQRSLLLPVNLQSPESADAYADVVVDITAKDAAGFPPTLTDPWGRLLSYQLLYGTDGGVRDTMSGIASITNITSYQVPFPIITARGVDAMGGQCIPPPNGTQYEFSPYEFGSWDSGVHAFSQIAYLGSHLSNGVPSSSLAATVTPGCTRNYDNLGYVLGTSSNLFNEGCAVIPPANSTTTLAPNLEVILNQVRSSSFRDLFAVYPNPFYQYLPNSAAVSSQKELYLVDGGIADQTPQNNPIWPFLFRPHVNVMIVNDNSADTDNFPDGTGIRNTYIQSQAVPSIANRMPYIPPASEFIAKGLNKRPTFFGCNSTSSSNAKKLFIVYLPNTAYSFPSNQSTLKLQYSVAETDGMIDNGFKVATKNGDPEWPKCLACAVMKKSLVANGAKRTSVGSAAEKRSDTAKIYDAPGSSSSSAAKACPTKKAKSPATEAGNEAAAVDTNGCQACFDQYCYN